MRKHYDFTRGVRGKYQKARTSATAGDMDRFVICIDHGGYAASLEIGKVYRVHTAPTSSPTGYALVVDESGEPYAYPKSCFRSVRLSAETRRRLFSPPAESPRRSSKALAASASCTASSLVVALADGRTKPLSHGSRGFNRHRPGNGRPGRYLAPERASDGKRSMKTSAWRASWTRACSSPRRPPPRPA